MKMEKNSAKHQLQLFRCCSTDAESSPESFPAVRTCRSQSTFRTWHRAASNVFHHSISGSEDVDVIVMLHSGGRLGAPALTPAAWGLLTMSIQVAIKIFVHYV